MGNTEPEKAELGQSNQGADGAASFQSLPTPVVAPLLPIASDLPLVERFQFLLHHSRLVIDSSGPYRLVDGHFTNYSKPREIEIQPDPEERFAEALACAQDSLDNPQHPGPVFDELRLFTDLFITSVILLD